MLSRSTLMVVLVFIFSQGRAQNLYFPPISGNTWQTIDAHSLGWDTTRLQALRTFLDTTDTRAFMVLKDGKIVLEYYFNDHNAAKPWYWASAGKSLTSVIVACAQADGKLSLDEPTARYLGPQWTSCSPQDEDRITVRHQLTMTTGLNDQEFECTEPACLSCFKVPGTRWAYHNSPYTLLDGVIEGATGQDLNDYLKTRLSATTGINGLYIKSGYNNVFYSTARVMARFGLLVLGKGKWNGNDIVKNPAYIQAMSQPSQNLNKSYGYLWWLNGRESFMLPQSQFVFPGSLLPNAPSDMFAALGKNDQKLYIIPSENLVILRMGNKGTSDNTAVPIVYDGMLWNILNTIIRPSAVTSYESNTNAWFSMNDRQITFDPAAGIVSAEIYDVAGKKLDAAPGHLNLDLSDLPPALYFIRGITRDNRVLSSSLFWWGQ